MSRCVVNGCRTASKRQSNETYVSMHGFPKSTSGIKLWLQQTGQDFGDIDAYAERIKQKSSYYRMCSAHFSEDSYYMHGIRKLLKPDAIPTIFNNQVTSSQPNAAPADIPSTSAVPLPENQSSFLPCKVIKIENDGTYVDPAPYANIPPTTVLPPAAILPPTTVLPPAAILPPLTVRPKARLLQPTSIVPSASVLPSASVAHPSFFPCNVVNFVNDGTFRPPTYGMFMDPSFMNPRQMHPVPSTPKLQHTSTNTMEIRTQDRGIMVKPVFGVHSTKTQTFFPWNKKNASTSTEDLIRKKDAYMWTGLTPTLVDCSTSTDDLFDFGTQLLLGSSNSKQVRNHSYFGITKMEHSPVPKSDGEETDNSSDVDSELEAKQEAKSLRKDPDYCPEVKEYIKEQSPVSVHDNSLISDEKEEKNHTYFTRRRRGSSSVPSSDVEDAENNSEVDSEMEELKDQQSLIMNSDDRPESMDYPLKEHSPMQNTDYIQETVNYPLKEQSPIKDKDSSQETMDYPLKEHSPITNPDYSLETTVFPLKKPSVIKDPDYRLETMDVPLQNQSKINDADYIPKKNDYLLKELPFTKDPNFSTKKPSCRNGNTKEELVQEMKFIVFESCLDALFKRLECSFDNQCKAHIVTFQKKVVGTLLIVYGECANGHRSKLWQSQPMIGEIAVGNLLSSAALLFSGNEFKKISEMFNFIGVSFVSEKSFSICQKKILLPIIDLHWKRDRQSTIASLKDKPLSLCGDRLNDNPEFCTYALLEDTSKKIIDYSTVQVSGKNSSMATESKAFRRCLNNVISEGLLVHILATDLHVGIKKIMRKEYSAIFHQFDVWNYSESIRKRLTYVAKKKTCKAITPWIPAILNHLWASSSECQGNVERIRETWKSVLHHVSNTHVWDDGILVNGCKHGELPKEECDECPWIQKNTTAYSALEDLICSAQIQKDMQRLTEYCHTTEIEMFHNMVLKYLPKSVKFKMDAIQARTKLAILAHNNNVNKPPVRIALVSESSGPAGCFRRKPFLPKSRERFQVEPVYECTFEYAFPMITDVLRLASGEISEIRQDLALNIVPIPQQTNPFEENPIFPFKRQRLEVY
ncbi:uncharacterized protein O3C94_021387 [Discoglossus pictus]